MNMDMRVVIICVVQVRTIIGHGSSMQGSHKVHGAPLGATDIAHVKSAYGFNPDEVQC
jgi:transketolase